MKTKGGSRTGFLRRKLQNQREMAFSKTGKTNKDRFSIVLFQNRVKLWYDTLTNKYYI